MTDRPILFSAPMVRALLAGRKTQTRRVLQLPTKGTYVHPKMGGWAPSTSGGGGCFTIDRQGNRHPVPEKVAIWHQTTGCCIVVPNQVGDRLWVRETVRAHEEGSEFVDGVTYLADDEWIPIANTQAAADQWVALNCYRGERGAKVVAIHMPRWVSRLTLTVVDVRVQRLQEINRDDAADEGIPEFFNDARKLGLPCEEGDGCEWDNRSTVENFQRLWESINGKGSWDANPWVACYAFTVEQRNIDA